VAQARPLPFGSVRRSGRLLVRAVLGMWAIIALGAATGWAELTPGQAATLSAAGLALGLYISLEALGGALHNVNLHEAREIGRVIAQGFAQGGAVGLVVGVSVLTVSVSSVAITLLVGAVAIYGATVIASQLANNLRTTHAQQPAPPVPPSLPFPGWLPGPPVIPGCEPVGAWFCWEPLPWWEWQPHWPKNVFLIPGDCAATPACRERWPFGPWIFPIPLMMAEDAEEADVDVVGELTLSAELGLDGHLISVLVDGHPRPDLDRQVALLAAAELDPPAAIPAPAALGLVVLGAGVLLLLARRSRR
jgi:hypothetical protein